MGLEAAGDTVGVDVAIFGGRGGGALAAATLARLAAARGGVRCVGFLNDFEPIGPASPDHPVLGGLAAWRDLPRATRFVAPLHKVKEMVRRAEIIRAVGCAA